MFDESRLGLESQSRVYRAWRSRLRGRKFILRNELDLSAMMGELAHVSVLALDARGYRFRLLGSGLRCKLNQDARDRLTSDLPTFRDEWAWTQALDQTLQICEPVTGRTRPKDRVKSAENGDQIRDIHFWMRLPMTSDGVRADLVLCHDRYLPVEALTNPDRAAGDADRRMRLDLMEPEMA